MAVATDWRMKYRDLHDDTFLSIDVAFPPMKVLLVEDSKVLAERVSEALRLIDIVDLIGTTDSEAVAISIVLKENVDVVILDLHLKQGTGFGVLRALANSPRKPYILVLTNFGLPEYKQAALELGATHFLDKARDSGRLSELLLNIEKCRTASTES